MSVNQNDTIYNIKQKIENIVFVSTDQQRLVFNDQTCDNNKTLS